MPKLIHVEFRDGSRCRMIPAALNLFLREKNWVRCFERAEGWISVGHDPLRGDGGEYSYWGRERREPVRSDGSNNR